MNESYFESIFAIFDKKPIFLFILNTYWALIWFSKYQWFPTRCIELFFELKVKSERSSVPVLLGTPFILQILKQKWETSWPSCWKFSTRSRRLADKQPCLLQLLEARPRWSLRLEPLLSLPMSPLQLPRQLGVAIVNAVREQGLAATSVQLLTRLPWQRHQPVLHCTLCTL